MGAQPPWRSHSLQPLASPDIWCWTVVQSTFMCIIPHHPLHHPVKKQTLLAPFLSRRNWRLSKLQWFAGSQTSSLNCVRIGHPLCYTSVFFTPLIAKEKTFPFNLSTITAVPPEMLPSETDKAQVTTSHCKISQCLLELWQRWQPSAGPSIFMIRTLQPGTSLLLSWSLPGKCAHSVHIRLYSEHRGWNNSAPCPFLCC